MLPEIYSYLTVFDFSHSLGMIMQFCQIGKFGIEFQSESTLWQGNTAVSILADAGRGGCRFSTWIFARNSTSAFWL